MNKNKAFKILLLNDDREGALLFEDYLADSPIYADLHCVQTKEEFLSALESYSFNAIICHNQLPDLDAINALKLCRQKDSEVPFIIVSETITKELAANALKLGANDVIEKQDYYRVIPVLERELDLKSLKSIKRIIEKKADKKEAILQLVTENIDEVIGLISTDGRIIYLSPSIEKLTGYKQAEFFGRRVYDYIGEKDAEKIRSTVKQDTYLNIKRTYKINLHINKRSGEELILECRIKPIISDSKIDKFAIVIKDKTPEIKYRSQASKSEKQFHLVLNELNQLILSSKSPFYCIDWEGRIIEWNPSCEEITEYSKEEVIGQNFLDLFIPPRDHLKFINLFKDVLLAGESINQEHEIVTKSGKLKSLLINATPRQNLQGELTGVLCYGQDITELVDYRQKLEDKVDERTRQLKKALEEEKQLAALKVKFVSMASHEFRTPLSTIKFAASFIKRYYDKATKEQVYKRLVKIEEQIDNMTYLLEDVLTMGKNDQVQIKPVYAEVNIKSFVESLKEEIEEQFPGYKFELDIKVDQQVIFSDRLLLRNICSNLLTNAIKYSPESNKVLWQFIQSDNHLTITVKDWGKGIPEEDQPKIFEPFYRSASTELITGTGLGLSIVKRAAESLGGRIEFFSKPNEGSNFIVYLPLYGKERNSTG